MEKPLHQLVRPLTPEETTKVDSLWEQDQPQALPTPEQVEQVFQAWDRDGKEGLVKLFREREAGKAGK